MSRRPRLTRLSPWPSPLRYEKARCGCLRISMSSYILAKDDSDTFVPGARAARMATDKGRPSSLAECVVSVQNDKLEWLVGCLLPEWIGEVTGRGSTQVGAGGGPLGRRAAGRRRDAQVVRLRSRHGGRGRGPRGRFELSRCHLCHRSMKRR